MYKVCPDALRTYTKYTDIFCDVNSVNFSIQRDLCPLLVRATTKMATLTELCAGLPLDPLPPLRPRDASLPHAPVRTPQLSGDEKKVNKTL